MKRFKNILALYGDMIGADDVFHQAVALASANHARLTFVDTLPERYTTEAEVKERLKRLTRLVPAIKAEGVPDVDVKVLVGQPFIEVIRQVIRADHDLVIASADGGRSLRDFYFGSTATHLMRKCPCAVWIVQPDQLPNYSKVLACIDPPPGDAGESELDRKILDLATSLARSGDAELHVIHAWEVEGPDRDTMRSEVPDATRQAILKKHEDKHRDRLAALLSHYALEDLKHKVHLPRGAPQAAIVQAVDEHGIDLIVMGTVCRTGISGLFIGNAAESVLSAVRCGIFTVKPRGFQTPVMILNDNQEPRTAEAHA